MKLFFFNFLFLSTVDDNLRRAVCIGLTNLQIVKRNVINTYASQLIPCVVLAQADSFLEIRAAGVELFTILHSVLGDQAVEGIIHLLLEKLVRFL